jgi:hypothetical protein
VPPPAPEEPPPELVIAGPVSGADDPQPPVTSGTAISGTMARPVRQLIEATSLRAEQSFAEAYPGHVTVASEDPRADCLLFGAPSGGAVSAQKLNESG